jgi:hypothetical protein
MQKSDKPLQEFRLSDFDANVSKILSSEFSWIRPAAWAQSRKYVGSCEKYSELFATLLVALGATNSFQSVTRLSLYDTRLENKIALDVLEGLIRHGARFEVFELSNYFVYFHHLLDLQRDRFDWIIFSRIFEIVHLKLDHNTIDTKILNSIAENWHHCLKRFDIDIRSSYRNIRFQFFRHRTDIFRSDALEWAEFNNKCSKVEVNVYFGARPSSRWRPDLFCDHYDNVSTTIVLLSKCKLLNEVVLCRSDFDVFVENVRNEYECLSPPYRHYGTYALSNMTKFSKFLWVKPSLSESLRHLRIDSVDWTNADTDATENVEKFLQNENKLEYLTIRAVMNNHFVEQAVQAAGRANSKLKYLSLIRISYRNSPNEKDQQILTKKDILNKYQKEIKKLKVFELEIIIRDEISEDPKQYNNRLFRQWRNQLELETIDLTNSDTDSDTD